MNRGLFINWTRLFFEPRKFVSIPGLIRYFSDTVTYRRLAGSSAPRWRDSHPQISDWRSDTPFDAHYFFQASWAARMLSAAPPVYHVDVGSSVTFIAVVSGFVKTVFVDLRPLRATLSNLIVLAGDLRSLPFADATLSSLSCLHTIEHVGLGRYGDRLDPRGSRKAAAELVRVLAPDGRLFISTPVGRERVEFNAHRVFAPDTVLAMFGELDLMSFSLVDDCGALHVNVSPAAAGGCEHGCGLFEFRRRGYGQA